MTTWTTDSKSVVENELLKEDGFSLLQENNDLILLEDSDMVWTYDQKS